MTKRSNGAANRTPLAVVEGIDDERGRVTVAPNDGRVAVHGWALDAGGAAFAEVEVDVGGAHASSSCMRSRADVAAILGSAERIGYHVDLVLDDAAVGHHAVTLHGRRANGSRVRIPVAASLDVVPPLRRLPKSAVRGALVGFVDEVAVEGSGSSSDGRSMVNVRSGRVVIVRGWAASADNVPATLVYAVIDGQRAVRGMSGYSRPDVAAALSSDTAAYGFRFRIAADEFGVGAHVLRVLAIVGDTMAEIGHVVRLSVADPDGPQVFEAAAPVRGRIDLVGRIDAETAVVEERAPLQLRARERAVVRGWAADPVAKLLPSRILLVVDGVAHGPVQRGLDCDDVAPEIGSDRLRGSGFSAVVRADALAPGFHRAELVALYGIEPVVFDSFSFEVIA